MHCDTSTRPVFDLTQHEHPHAVHAGALRFVCGIRGFRRNPVTRTQIGDWLKRTPAEAVDAALVDLIAEGKISTGPLSLRNSSNRAKRAFGYWACNLDPHCMTPVRFHECLAALDWSQRGFAALIGVDERQVRRWAAGAKMPAPVAEWLETLAKFHEQHPPPSKPDATPIQT